MPHERSRSPGAGRRSTHRTPSRDTTIPAKQSVRPYGGQARFYDLEYRDYDADLAFYLLRLQQTRAAGPLLELGCGTGRVALPLLRAGFAVTGVDISEPMLRRARRRRAALAPEDAARLHFLRQDMSCFRSPQRFGAVLVPFSGYALLPRADARLSCLAHCRAHMLPGARLWLDLFAPRVVDPSAPRRYRRVLPAPAYDETLTKEVEEWAAAGEPVDRIVYRFRRQSATSGELLEEFEIRFELARLDFVTVEDELQAAGFELLKVFGSYRGDDYEEGSERMIFEARPRALAGA